MPSNKNFQTRHAERYALEPQLEQVDGAPAGHGKVVGAVCLLCKTFGREAKVALPQQADGEPAPKKPRAKRSSVQVFRSYRTDKYETHHKSEHPRKYAEYKAILEQHQANPAARKEAVKLFFKNGTKGLNSFFDGNKAVVFSFDRQIVDVLIKEVLFDPDDLDENVMETKEKAMSIFKQPEQVDSDVEDQDDAAVPDECYYYVSIPQAKLFKATVEFVAAGNTFRQASINIGITRKEFNDQRYEKPFRNFVTLIDTLWN